MSRPETLAIRPRCDGRLVEDSNEAFPADRTPNDTCSHYSTEITAVDQFNLHSVRSFRERLDHKFLVLLPPSLHDLLRIRVDNRPNIVCNILLLSSFVVKGYSERSQRFKDAAYVELWSASDTNMKILKREIEELLQKLKHHLAR